MSHSLDWRCEVCERPSQQALTVDKALTCHRCGHAQAISTGARADSGELCDPVQTCFACGSERLYVQKDFNRTLGVAIVAVGAVLSPWTYGASLLACMLIDYGLYYVVPEITVCYGCDAIHRGFEHNPAHRAHDPLLAERFRKKAQAETGARTSED